MTKVDIMALQRRAGIKTFDPAEDPNLVDEYVVGYYEALLLPGGSSLLKSPGIEKAKRDVEEWLKGRGLNGRGWRL